MNLLKTQMITGVVTLMLGACIAASWLHFRPLEIPRFIAEAQLERFNYSW